MGGGGGVGNGGWFAKLETDGKLNEVVSVGDKPGVMLPMPPIMTEANTGSLTNDDDWEPWYAGVSGVDGDCCCCNDIMSESLCELLLLL